LATTTVSLWKNSVQARTGWGCRQIALAGPAAPKNRHASDAQIVLDIMLLISFLPRNVIGPGLVESPSYP